MKYLPNTNTELSSVAADRYDLAEPRYISVEDKCPVGESMLFPPVTSKA